MSASNSELLLQNQAVLSFLNRFWLFVSERFEALSQTKERQNDSFRSSAQPHQLAAASKQLDMNLSNIFEVLVSIYIRLMNLNYVSYAKSLNIRIQRSAINLRLHSR